MRVLVCHLSAKAAGMKLSPSATANALSPKFAYELRELRIFLYQLLAQAAAHKSLYFCPVSFVFVYAKICKNFCFFYGYF